MNNPALMELADRMAEVCNSLGRIDAEDAYSARPAIEAARAEVDAITTQLRTAAAEGGEDRFAEILHRLDSWCQAYPEDVFTPTTHEEIQAVATAFPGMVDRISASMGRHMVKHMRAMADTIRNLTPTDSGAGRDGERLDWLAHHGGSLRQDAIAPNHWYVVAVYHTGIPSVDDRHRYPTIREAIDAARAESK